MADSSKKTTQKANKKSNDKSNSDGGKFEKVGESNFGTPIYENTSTGQRIATDKDPNTSTSGKRSQGGSGGGSSSTPTERVQKQYGSDNISSNVVQLSSGKFVREGSSDDDGSRIATRKRAPSISGVSSGSGGLSRQQLQRLAETSQEKKETSRVSQLLNQPIDSDKPPSAVEFYSKHGGASPGRLVSDTIETARLRRQGVDIPTYQERRSRELAQEQRRIQKETDATNRKRQDQFLSRMPIETQIVGSVIRGVVADDEVVVEDNFFSRQGQLSRIERGSASVKDVGVNLWQGLAGLGGTITYAVTGETEKRQKEQRRAARLFQGVPVAQKYEDTLIGNLGGAVSSPAGAGLTVATAGGASGIAGQLARGLTLGTAGFQTTRATARGAQRIISPTIRGSEFQSTNPQDDRLIIGQAIRDVEQSFGDYDRFYQGAAWARDQKQAVVGEYEAAADRQGLTGTERTNFINRGVKLWESGVRKEFKQQFGNKKGKQFADDVVAGRNPDLKWYDKTQNLPLLGWTINPRASLYQVSLFAGDKEVTKKSIERSVRERNPTLTDKQVKERTNYYYSQYKAEATGQLAGYVGIEAGGELAGAGILSNLFRQSGKAGLVVTGEKAFGTFAKKGFQTGARAGVVEGAVGTIGQAQIYQTDVVPSDVLRNAAVGATTAGVFNALSLGFAGEAATATGIGARKARRASKLVTGVGYFVDPYEFAGDIATSRVIRPVAKKAGIELAEPVLYKTAVAGERAVAFDAVDAVMRKSSFKSLDFVPKPTKVPTPAFSIPSVTAANEASVWGADMSGQVAQGKPKVQSKSTLFSQVGANQENFAVAGNVNTNVQTQTNNRANTKSLLNNFFGINIPTTTQTDVQVEQPIDVSTELPIGDNINSFIGTNIPVSTQTNMPISTNVPIITPVFRIPPPLPLGAPALGTGKGKGGVGKKRSKFVDELGLAVSYFGQDLANPLVPYSAPVKKKSGGRRAKRTQPVRGGVNTSLNKLFGVNL